MAIDRYLVIGRPLNLARKPTCMWACIAVGLIWFYSAVFASLPLFGFGQYVPEGYLTSCSFNYLSEDAGTRIFVLIFFVAAWVFPLSIIVFCYTAIIRAVYYVRQNIIRERIRELQNDSPLGAKPSTTSRNHERKGRFQHQRF